MYFQHIFRLEISLLEMPRISELQQIQMLLYQLKQAYKHIFKVVSLVIKQTTLLPMFVAE
jgi:hypothetical protein